MSPHLTRIVVQLDYKQRFGRPLPNELVLKLQQHIKEFCKMEPGLQLLVIGFGDDAEEPAPPQLRLVEFPRAQIDEPTS